MRTTDDNLLAEAYDGMLKANKEGSSLVKSELKKPAFSDQDPTVMTQDGQDKTKKDPYVLKEDGTPVNGEGDLEPDYPNSSSFQDPHAGLQFRPTGNPDLDEIIADVIQLGAHETEEVLTALRDSIARDVEMITNMDANALVQHLTAAINVISSRTGE